MTAGDGVGTGKVFHYVNGRFDVHQRVYRITDFDDDLSGKFFLFQFSTLFFYGILSMTATSSVDSVRMEMIAGMQIPLPPTKAEQEAIAEALSDADALIESLEQLIAKKRQIKQGAMQELLTGKKRLPSFSGEWEETTIGGLASLWKGGSNPGLHPERIFTHYSLPAFDNGRAPVTDPGRLIGSNKFTVPPGSVLQTQSSNSQNLGTR